MADILNNLFGGKAPEAKPDAAVDSGTSFLDELKGWNGTERDAMASRKPMASIEAQRGGIERRAMMSVGMRQPETKQQPSSRTLLCQLCHDFSLRASIDVY